MKWMIASDIHGSARWCALLAQAVERERPDRILLLGDLLYHGPRNALPEDYSCPKTAEILNGWRERIVAVRGNCDAEVDQMVLDFPMMADYALLEAEGLPLFATHGHLWNEENLPPMKKGTIFLNGHTHVPACRDHGDYVYLNPGSVSIPKEGSSRGYLTLEGGLFRWKTLEGDTCRQYRAGEEKI